MVDIMSGLLSGMRGPLGGLGREYLREAEQDRRARYAQQAGLMPQRNVIDQEGNIQPDLLSQHMYGGGYYEQGLPLVTMSYNNRMQAARQEDQQAFELEKLAKSNEYAMQAQERAAQAAREAAFNAPPEPQQMAGVNDRIGMFEGSVSAIQNYENLLDQVATGGGTTMDPQRLGQMRNQVGQLVSGIVKSRYGAGASEEEYNRVLQQTLGTDSIESWTDLMGRNSKKAIGALQQGLAQERITAARLGQGLDYETAGNKWTQQRWQQVQSQTPPHIRSLDLVQAQKSAMDVAAQQQGLTERPTTSEAYDRRTQRQRQQGKGHQ